MRVFPHCVQREGAGGGGSGSGSVGGVNDDPSADCNIAAAAAAAAASAAPLLLRPQPVLEGLPGSLVVLTSSRLATPRDSDGVSDSSSVGSGPAGCVDGQQCALFRLAALLASSVVMVCRGDLHGSDCDVASKFATTADLFDFRRGCASEFSHDPDM
jgi:hypothetical protein